MRMRLLIDEEILRIWIAAKIFPTTVGNEVDLERRRKSRHAISAADQGLNSRWLVNLQKIRAWRTFATR